MATKGKYVSEDFRNTCSLCMETYHHRQPKILPCFHTFCLPCLDTLAATAASSGRPREAESSESTEDGKSLSDTNAESALTEKSDGTNGNGSTESGAQGSENRPTVRQNDNQNESAVVFQCPTCRSPVTVPEGGVENLQTNFYLDVQEDSTPARPAQCDMCEEGERYDATHFCGKCQQHMCRTCQRLHDKFTDASTHQVQPLKVVDWPRKTETQNIMCRIHPDQPVCLHCVKCDVSICMLCKLTAHEGHSTEDMASAIRRAREELNGLLAVAQQQIQVVERQVSRLDRDEREVLRQKQDMAQEAGARFDIAIARLTRARDEYLEVLAAKEHGTLSGIRAEKMVAQDTVETLSRLVARSKVDQDVVILRNDLRSSLLSDDILETRRKEANREENRTYFACLVDTSGLEQDLVRAYIGEFQDVDVDQATSLKPTTPVNLRGLCSMVEDLLTTYKSQMQEINDKIETAAKQVSFHARLKTNCARGVIRGIILFEEVKSNEGNCYDNGTGYFTAPCAGIYVFHATVRSAGPGKSAEIYIRTTTGFTSTTATGTQSKIGTAHMITRLQRQEKVCVYLSCGTAVGESTSFQGALIQADI